MEILSAAFLKFNPGVVIGFRTDLEQVNGIECVTGIRGYPSRRLFWISLAESIEVKVNSTKSYVYL